MPIDPNHTPTDFQLIQLSRLGDRQAYGELVSRHYGSCVNLATYILRNRAEAEDEVQQALWKAFKHLDQYLGEAEFFTWLLRIVVNECRMLIRDKKRARFLYIDAGHSGSGGRPMEPPSPDTDPEHEALKGEMIEMLRAEIRRIPPLFRKVILLRDMEGLTMQEVADRLGITVPAAKSRLLRARGELRRRIMRRSGAGRLDTSLSAKTIPFKTRQQESVAVA